MIAVILAMVMARISEPEQVLVTPDGLYTNAFQGGIMSAQSIQSQTPPLPLSRGQKRRLQHGDRLREEARQRYQKDRERARDYYQRNRERVLAAAEEWQKKHPERVKLLNRSHSLERKYGISLEQYDLLLKKQDSLCAICRRPPVRRRLAVDHRHSDGVVRGLLCTKCNVAIGLLGEDEEAVRRLLKYLRKRHVPRGMLF